MLCAGRQLLGCVPALPSLPCAAPGPPMHLYVTHWLCFCCLQAASSCGVGACQHQGGMPLCHGPVVPADQGQQHPIRQPCCCCCLLLLAWLLLCVVVHVVNHHTALHSVCVGPCVHTPLVTVVRSSLSLLCFGRVRSAIWSCNILCRKGGRRPLCAPFCVLLLHTQNTTAAFGAACGYHVLCGGPCGSLCSCCCGVVWLGGRSCLLCCRPRRVGCRCRPCGKGGVVTW